MSLCNDPLIEYALYPRGFNNLLPEYQNIIAAAAKLQRDIIFDCIDWDKLSSLSGKYTVFLI